MRNLEIFSFIHTHTGYFRLKCMQEKLGLNALIASSTLRVGLRYEHSEGVPNNQKLVAVIISEGMQGWRLICGCV